MPFRQPGSRPDVKEARDWVPVWMCASVYAYRTEVDFAGEVAFATSGKLAAQLRSGMLPSSREAIVEFYKETYGACDSGLLQAMVDVLGVDAEQETYGRWDEEQVGLRLRSARDCGSPAGLIRRHGRDRARAR